MNPFKFSNVAKGKLTSLIGLIVILASVVSVFYPGVSWAEAGGGLSVGVALLGLPDPTRPGPGAMIVVAGFLMPLTGCVSYQRCIDKYGGQAAAPSVVKVSDSVKVPVTITTKADSIGATLDIDSLSRAATRDTVVIVSAGGTDTLYLWKSADGTKLHTRVKVPQKEIHDTITTYVTLQAQCPPCPQLRPKPGWLEVWVGRYQRFCTVAFTGSLVAFLALFALRRRTA